MNSETGSKQQLNPIDDDPITSDEALALRNEWYGRYMMASFFNSELAEKNRQRCVYYGDLYEKLLAKEAQDASDDEGGAS